MLLSKNARTSGKTGLISCACGCIFISSIFLGVIRVAGFYYQSTEQIGVSSWLIYGDSFLALPLCLYTLPLLLNLDGVWLAMPVSRVLLAVLLLYFWFGRKKGTTQA